MALISRAIPGFYNGINQQPASVRLDTQLDEQINGYSSLVDGLVKRQNTEHLALLTSNSKTNSFTHTILRDETERYIVIFTDDTNEPIEVYDVAGAKCNVRYGNLADDLTFTEDLTVKSYVQTTEPFKNIRATTINDYTLVCNRTKKVTMTASVVSGSITGKVQTFSKLPGTPSSGQIYEIAGDNNNNFDSYFVSFDGSVWNQCAMPGVKNEIDKSTMPHKLVRTNTLEFTFSPIIYDKRIVGDDVTNPIPSFVDSYVNNIFFFKGRTGFLSVDRVVMSRTNDFFNFWKSTVLDYLADDVIDIDVSSTLPNSAVNLLEYAPFNTNLILVSAGQQFSLQSSSTVLSPTTVACTPVTTFEFNPWSTICVAGTNVIFPCKSGNYTTFREYYVQPDSLLNDAADITSHVPNYIPSGNVQTEVCNALDVLFSQSSSEPSALYVYKYMWRDNEKVQSSWSKWVFSGDIIGFGVIETDLFIVIKRNGQVCLEKIQLKRVYSGSLNFRVHLDRMASLTGVYDSNSNETTFTLPYNEPLDIGIVDKSTGQLLLNQIRVDNNHVKVRGDFSSKQYWVGLDYEFKARFSEFYIKDANSKAPFVGGVIKIRTMTLTFAETGYYRVEVTPQARQVLRHDFTGVIIGSSKIGRPYISSGSKRFIVLSDSHNTKVEVINDSYLPCAFQAGAVEAIWTQRAKLL